MAISPWYVGQTDPPLTITLNLDSGAENLTGVQASQLSMTFRNTNGTFDTSGTGTFAITTANPAVITYTLSANDVANPGTFSLIIKKTTSSGVKIYDPISFTLTAV